MGFPYVRRALRLDQIASYVASYSFTATLPDFVVLHHSAVPSASWAPAGDAHPWDEDEHGLSDSQIYAKRLARLDSVYRYYANTLGWSAGPHAFIDERYVWLMTPLDRVGIHAKWGNSFRAGGKLHYSIGIELIGNFDKVTWHAEQARLCGMFIGALAQRLGTFKLDYMYGDPASKPGMAGTGDNQRCLHPERLRWGGLSSHRDYNKPECPGKAITEDYYVRTIRRYAGQPAIVPPLQKWRVRDDVDYAAVRVAANRNATPAAIGSNPVRLPPGFVVASDLAINGWLHIAQPDTWGYSAQSNFVSVAVDTPVGARP